MNPKRIALLLILALILSGCAALLPSKASLPMESIKREISETQTAYASFQLRAIEKKPQVPTADWERLKALDAKVVAASNALTRAVKLWERFGVEPADLNLKLNDFLDAWADFNTFAQILLGGLR